MPASSICTSNDQENDNNASVESETTRRQMNGDNLITRNAVFNDTNETMLTVSDQQRNAVNDQGLPDSMDEMILLTKLFSELSLNDDGNGKQYVKQSIDVSGVSGDETLNEDKNTSKNDLVVGVEHSVKLINSETVVSLTGDVSEVHGEAASVSASEVEIRKVTISPKELKTTLKAGNSVQLNSNELGKNRVTDKVEDKSLSVLNSGKREGINMVGGKNNVEDVISPNESFKMYAGDGVSSLMDKSNNSLNVSEVKKVMRDPDMRSKMKRKIDDRSRANDTTERKYEIEVKTSMNTALSTSMSDETEWDENFDVTPPRLESPYETKVDGTLKKTKRRSRKVHSKKSPRKITMDGQLNTQANTSHSTNFDSEQNEKQTEVTLRELVLTQLPAGPSSGHAVRHFNDLPLPVEVIDEYLKFECAEDMQDKRDESLVADNELNIDTSIDSAKQEDNDSHLTHTPESLCGFGETSITRKRKRKMCNSPPKRFDNPGAIDSSKCNTEAVLTERKLVMLDNTTTLTEERGGFEVRNYIGLSNTSGSGSSSNGKIDEVKLLDNREDVDKSTPPVVETVSEIVENCNDVSSTQVEIEVKHGCSVVAAGFSMEAVNLEGLANSNEIDDENGSNLTLTEVSEQVEDLEGDTNSNKIDGEDERCATPTGVLVGVENLDGLANSNEIDDVDGSNLTLTEVSEQVEDLEGSTNSNKVEGDAGRSATSTGFSPEVENLEGSTNSNIIEPVDGHNGAYTFMGERNSTRSGSWNYYSGYNRYHEIEGRNERTWSVSKKVMKVHDSPCHSKHGDRVDQEFEKDSENGSVSTQSATKGIENNHEESSDYDNDFGGGHYGELDGWGGFFSSTTPRESLISNGSNDYWGSSSYNMFQNGGYTGYAANGVRAGEVIPTKILTEAERKEKERRESNIRKLMDLWGFNTRAKELFDEKVIWLNGRLLDYGIISRSLFQDYETPEEIMQFLDAKLPNLINRRNQEINGETLRVDNHTNGFHFKHSILRMEITYISHEIREFNMMYHSHKMKIIDSHRQEVSKLMESIAELNRVFENMPQDKDKATVEDTNSAQATTGSGEMSENEDMEDDDDL